MIYTIKDTATGFRLTMSGATRDYIYNEIGGHGPVEELYLKTASVWLDLRAEERATARNEDAVFITQEEARIASETILISPKDLERGYTAEEEELRDKAGDTLARFLEQKREWRIRR